MFSTSLISPPGGWGSQKPPCGAPIDRGHPLARWIARLPFNEGSGGILNDAMRTVQPTLYGAPVWTPTVAGPGLRFDGTTNYLSWISPRFDNLTAGWTLLMRVAPDSLAYPNYLIRKPSKLALQVTYGSASITLYSTWTSTSGQYTFAKPPLGVPTTMLISVNLTSAANVPIVLYDGVPQTVTVVTPTSGSPRQEGATPLYIGYHGTLGAGFYYVGTMLDFGFADYAMTVQEMQALTAGPYDMFAAGTPMVLHPSARPLIDSSLNSASPLRGAIV